ncbi:hypothetical protein VCHA51O444_10531 [Vibrio chagasii]|nr:hypothetical protein VCHA51O444_10531 [Vibrio chagasii]CAH7351568.1 hypothetical protein VCHA53O474_30339 [Vibrio chagasii]
MFIPNDKINILPRFQGCETNYILLINVENELVCGNILHLIRPSDDI